MCIIDSCLSTIPAATYSSDYKMRNEICYCWLREHLTFRNLSALICSVLTLVLICQELYTFVAIKPTSTSNEEKALETRDLPETVVCIEPGFDNDVLQKYGYKFGNTYFRGSIERQNLLAGMETELKTVLHLAF